MLHECICCAVGDRLSGRFAAALDLYPAGFQQSIDGRLRDRDTAHRFNLRPGHGLAVCNDCKRLQRGLSESLLHLPFFDEQVG